MASCIPRTKRCSGRPVPAGSTFDRWAYRDETPMFILAHLGIGLGLTWLLAWKSPARFDYRLVLFGSILPDLIDKPLGYAFCLTVPCSQAVRPRHEQSYPTGSRRILKRYSQGQGL